MKKAEKMKLTERALTDAVCRVSPWLAPLPTARAPWTRRERSTMYKLMVSYDAGCSYVEEVTADDPSKFNERCDQLDRDGLRWAIEDESGNPVHRVCAIHAHIHAFMEAVNVAARGGGEQEGQ